MGTERSDTDAEYRARILVEVALLPDNSRRRPGSSADERAVFDACNVKSYLEDPEIQTRIDEDGSRGRIIGAWVQDVRRADFSHPLPVEEILGKDLKRRVEESSR
jgi:hypothetical protein